MSARRLTLTFLVSLCGLAGVLVFSGVPALASPTRHFITSFGLFSNPHGLAIDQSDQDLYVADTGNNRIEKFDRMGNFLLAFGANVGGPGINTCTVICEPGTHGSAPGEFTEAQFIAVDDSGGPSNGDVYVADTGDHLVSKFDSSGNLIATWGTNGQLDGSTATKGPFGEIAGIAVDSAGRLLVLNASSQEFVFAQDGTFSEQVELPGSGGTVARGAAVDASGDFFKIDYEYAAVEKYDPAHKNLGRITNFANGYPVTIAVEPISGDLYVATLEAINHYAFNGSGEVIESEGPPCAPSPSEGCAPSDSTSISGFVGGGGVPFANGLAVDSAASGDTYVSNSSTGQVYVYGPAVTFPVTGHANKIHRTSATLNGTVYPEGSLLTDCHFEYGPHTSYGHSVPCAQTPAQIGSGSSPVAVSAEATGLKEGETSHFRLVMTFAKGTYEGDDQSFTTTTPPSIDGAGPLNVTVSSADITAKINPDNGATTYRFEYGTTTSYGTSVPIPDGEIGEGSIDVGVSQHLTGLSANVIYHFRVVATNESATTTSADHTFIYDESGGGLPDNRAYEMVTPPQKNGALINHVLFGPVPDIAEDGSRVILGSIQCFAGAGSCISIRQHVGTPYEFTRTAGGWVTTPLAPSAAQFEANTWSKYSADAGTALFSAPTPPHLEDDFQARQPDGSFLDVGPLTPPSEGRTPNGTIQDIFLGPVLATADLSHVFYEEGLMALEYIGAGNTAPILVAVSGGQGSTNRIGGCGRELFASQGNALSADGRTVFFKAGGCGNEGSKLYARIDGELSDAHTVDISERSPTECTGECLGSPPGGASFLGASTDGSRVFFTDAQQLTDNATEAASGGCTETVGDGCNLYEYDFGALEGHNLIDASACGGCVGGPRVQGVMAVSSDGSHVYFVAKGVLSGAANDQGQSAVAGANNLYVFERDSTYPDGRVAFIAALPSALNNPWANSAEYGADVTPDGRFLVFTSGGALTPGDTRTDGAQQVFRYDAQTQELVRISIGEHGFNDNGNAGTGDASIVPGEAGGFRAAPARSDPTMSHDGSYIFFTSPVGLTPTALNDVTLGTDEHGSPEYAENVYEYHDGHVYLISDGRDTSVVGNPSSVDVASAVELIGTDAAGANVFFSTTDELVPQDTDAQLDVYDARICTASEPCIKAPPPPLPPCLGEACHGIPAATPSLLTPGSSSFNGQGNITPTPAAKPRSRPTQCKRGFVKKKAKCVKRPRAKRKTKAKKASDKRRAKR